MKFKILCACLSLSLIISNLPNVHAQETNRLFWEKEENSFKEGLYTINSRLIGYSLEPGDEEIVYSALRMENEDQAWIISNAGIGKYKIISTKNGKALTVDYKDDFDSNTLITKEYTDSLEQKWFFKKTMMDSTPFILVLEQIIAYNTVLFHLLLFLKRTTTHINILNCSLNKSYLLKTKSSVRQRT